MSIFHNPPDQIERLRSLWKEKPWTKPRPCGLSPSMGYGDRLGLATPGHLLAHQRMGMAGRVTPIFAQQSGREMERIGRKPPEVLWDASMALADASDCSSWGADADHMKTEEQISACVEAGFTFFTVDPSDAVRDEVHRLTDNQVEHQFAELCATQSQVFGHYLETYTQPHAIAGIGEISSDETSIQRVALTYGQAILRIQTLYHWVEQCWKSEIPFDFEVSVDETSNPTSPLAHLIIARELKRLGVRFTSLAPRFVGEFQKAIDYIGDLRAFETDFRIHAAIARQEGPYKISVHSGSDKFSLYPSIARETEGQVHLKTSGTSYLEALRIAARHDPALFRGIAAFSASVFEEQRKSYHIKASLREFPDPVCVNDEDLEKDYVAYPGADSPRQVLHVCFGAVLSADGGKRFAQPLKALLRESLGEYAEALARHLGRHLVVFG
jgi:tagaturonate epimerase